MKQLEFAVIEHDEYLDFSGPLDAILLLLSRDKIEIADISLTRLVEQYLEMLSGWESLDMEIATEFTVMASHLVYLKTRMLLKVDEQRDEEVDTLMLALEQRRNAEKYEAAQWLAGWLADNRSGFDCIAKPPTVDADYRLEHNVEDLFKAYVSLIFRGEDEVDAGEMFGGLVGREPYSVEIEMNRISERITTNKKVFFSDLLRECADNPQKVAVFLALLALCKDCVVVPKDGKGGLYFTGAR